MAKNKVKVNTGMGYFKKDGKIISKFDFIPGSEHMIDDSIEIVEVANKQELGAVEVYADPITEEEERNDLIAAEIREIAIESLKAKNKLDKDGKIKK